MPPELDGAVVTNDFWYFDTDPREINPAFFLYLTSTDLFSEICRKASDGTTNRVRLQADEFFDYELDLPPVDQQAELLARIQATDEKSSALTAENQRQTTLLRQLRQQLLQEAVRGELTRAWREENPTPESASALLARIRAEKAELIKAGKIKKEKPLPPLAPDEVPFALPEGWVWCRLGEASEIFSGVTLGKTYRGELVKTPYLRVANVQRGFLDLSQIKYLSLPLSDTEKYQLSFGDLLVNEGGDFDKVGRCATWRNEIENCIHQNHLFKVRPYFSMFAWIEFAINSDSSREYFLGAYKKMTNLTSINKT